MADQLRGSKYTQCGQYVQGGGRGVAAGPHGRQHAAHSAQTELAGGGGATKGVGGDTVCSTQSSSSPPQACILQLGAAREHCVTKLRPLYCQQTNNNVGQDPFGSCTGPHARHQPHAKILRQPCASTLTSMYHLTTVALDEIALEGSKGVLCVSHAVEADRWLV